MKTTSYIKQRNTGEQTLHSWGEKPALSLGRHIIAKTDMFCLFLLHMQRLESPAVSRFGMGMEMQCGMGTTSPRNASVLEWHSWELSYREPSMLFLSQPTGLLLSLCISLPSFAPLFPLFLALLSIPKAVIIPRPLPYPVSSCPGLEEGWPGCCMAVQETTSKLLGARNGSRECMTAWTMWTT